MKGRGNRDDARNRGDFTETLLRKCDFFIEKADGTSGEPEKICPAERKKRAYVLLMRWNEGE